MVEEVGVSFTTGTVKALRPKHKDEQSRFVES